MKRNIIVLFGVSVFAGLGYVFWVYSPIGKSTLRKWLLSRWRKVARREKKEIDFTHIAKELQKLSYADHELLVKYTRIILVPEDQWTPQQKEKLHKSLHKITSKKLFDKVDFKSLENSVFPG